ncbi:sialoadhesin-like isoform X1 [Labeo rohita]|uniref:Sialoadhesin-like isoform X1 n=1 Tax=Labeo rohita TaxID=84645 RepID=A0A498P2Y9_LABRO|nr:sialoadhesin-like isoform X1 [Labeo rohita]
MNSRLSALILLLLIQGFVTLDRLSVICNQKSICAVKGTKVLLMCFYSNINIKTVFWFSGKQSTNWRKNNEPEDLTLDSDYSGRVKHQISNSSSTLTISDVRERDSGEYQLMFIMNDGVKHLRSAAVSLTVTDLQMTKNPASTDLRHENVKLTCNTSCALTHGVRYYWMKNGQNFTNTESGNMFVSPSSDSGSFSCSLNQNLKRRSSSVCVSQSVCWDVTYTSTRVCALVNSTVDISCTYSHPSNYTVNKTFWHYGPSDGPSQDIKDLREEHQFVGRVDYIWYKNRRQVTDGFTKVNKLYLDSVINEELQQYSCAVGVQIPSSSFESSTALLITVIILSVFLILTFIGVLLYRSRKNNSPHQHEGNNGSVQNLLFHICSSAVCPSELLE